MRIAERREQSASALETELERARGAREEIVERRAVVAQGDDHPDAAGLPLM